MKKILMIVVVMMAALSSYAQEMYLGGGISLWRDCDADVTSFSISPDFGYNLNERWAVGGEVVFSHEGTHYDVGDEKVSSHINSFAIAPYARYSFYENKIVRLFIDMGMGFSTSKPKHGDSVNGFEIGLKPGLAIKLNDSFSFITKVGFAGYRDDYFRGADGFGVTLDEYTESLSHELACGRLFYCIIKTDRCKNVGYYSHYRCFSILFPFF